MATFTFITDYLGGTYICQQTADSLPSACHLWRDHVVSGRYIQDLNVHQFSEAFDADIDELPPVAIDEIMNVWLFQLLLGEEMLSTHIILTDRASTFDSKEPKGNRISSQPHI